MPQTQASPISAPASYVAAGFPRHIQGWQLGELAGEGSLSSVFRARPADASPDSPAAYALKMLKPEWEDDPRAVRLLAREAQVGRSISHPHLISVLDTGLLHKPRFVVMPWLEGRTLQADIDARRHPNLTTALWIARQVAEALRALHEHGWIHGDVKPGNIFLSSEGHATLVDLGFARCGDEVGSAVEREVTGTCTHLAPEWITSAYRADIRSDVYSLGVVLYELLSGVRPFSGGTLAELATQHKQAAVPDLASLVPDLPPEVARLVRRMLAKDPLRRPQTPQELAEDLARLEIASLRRH